MNNPNHHHGNRPIQSSGNSVSGRLSLPGDRREDPFVTSYKEMLVLVQRMYDMTGQPDLKVMIDKAHSNLGRVPS